MKYSYYYCEPYRDYLEEWLVENGIRYVHSQETKNLIFYLHSNNKQCTNLQNQLLQRNIRHITAYVDFSQKEKDEAKWLWLWPKTNRVEILNDEYRTDRDCPNLRIKKEPSDKTPTAFSYEADGGCNRLFADHRIVRLVEEHDLKGFEFSTVTLRNGQTSEKIFELTSNEVISRETVSLGHGEKPPIRPAEGIETYYINAGGSYILHLFTEDLDKSIDLYRTERMWFGRFPAPLYVISNRFYQLLKTNKLIGKVNIHPVIEVNR